MPKLFEFPVMDPTGHAYEFIQVVCSACGEMHAIPNPKSVEFMPSWCPFCGHKVSSFTHLNDPKQITFTTSGLEMTDQIRADLISREMEDKRAPPQTQVPTHRPPSRPMGPKIPVDLGIVNPDVLALVRRLAHALGMQPDQIGIVLYPEGGRPA